MGHDWWGHAARTKAQSVWRAGVPPKQSGGKAVPRSKNCSYQSCPANWQARLLVPWFMDMAPSSSKKWEEVWAETSPVPSNIHRCTVTMDLCYSGESVTRDNFYLTSSRATLKQNAALPLSLLRCLIWQLLSSFRWKLSTVLLRSLISEWMGKWCTSCKAPNSQPIIFFQTLRVHQDLVSREPICFREIKYQAEAAMPYVREALEGAEGVHINYLFLGWKMCHSLKRMSNIHTHMLKVHLA